MPIYSPRAENSQASKEINDAPHGPYTWSPTLNLLPGPVAMTTPKPPARMTWHPPFDVNIRHSPPGNLGPIPLRSGQVVDSCGHRECSPALRDPS